MVSAARNLPADPGNTEPLWEIKTGTHQYSIPTIDRGRIFIAANDSGIERAGCKSTGGGVVMCVDQATGKLIWRLPIPRYFAGVKPPYHFDQWDCGVCSGPVATATAFMWWAAGAKFCAWTAKARPTATTGRSWRNSLTWG